MAIVCLSPLSFAQEVERPFDRCWSWTLLQAIPSPLLFSDSSGSSPKIRAALRWQVIPVNISFSANRFVPTVQFFMISPARRFAGSVEFFLQPGVALALPSRWKPAWLSAGFRAVFPLLSSGELLSGSVGVKCHFQGVREDTLKGAVGLEAGLYLYGMLGLQADWHFLPERRFSLGLYLKYY